MHTSANPVSTTTASTSRDAPSNPLTENFDSVGKSKVIIQDIAGCGKFQVIITFCVYFFANSSPVFTMLFMAFGNYNPGWKCVQHNSTILLNDSNSIGVNTIIKPHGTLSEVVNKMLYPGNDNATKTTGYNTTPDNLLTESCHVFEACERIEFSHESSTIVSEWGLACSRRWIPSIIVSIQMAGVLVGSLFAGYLGDAIGRKVTIYGALLVLTCFNLVSIFSSSWQMFAVVRFFLGLSMSCVISLYSVFTIEFIPSSWRSFIFGLPAWSISSIFFSLACMYLKDWRSIHIVTASLGALGLIPAIWIPESLRWLEVKNKAKSFSSAAHKVAKTNGRSLPSMEDLEKMAKQENDSQTRIVKTYNFIYLFKKGIKKYTCLLSVPFFILSLVSYALEFGVKALHGDFYINLIIWNLINVPFAIVPIILPNLLGRKFSALIFIGMTAICLLGSSCVDRLAPDSWKGVWVSVLIYIGKVFLEALWCVMATFLVEIYPTVIRGLGMSWCLLVARIGGIIAPFFIPDDENSVFISYTTMGVLILVCSIFVVRLPETKGRNLQDTCDSE